MKKLCVVPTLLLSVSIVLVCCSIAYADTMQDAVAAKAQAVADMEDASEAIYQAQSDYDDEEGHACDTYIGYEDYCELAEGEPCYACGTYQHYEDGWDDLHDDPLFNAYTEIQDAIGFRDEGDDAFSDGNDHFALQEWDQAVDDYEVAEIYYEAATNVAGNHAQTYLSRAHAHFGDCDAITGADPSCDGPGN